jgi:hypothetical protein
MDKPIPYNRSSQIVYTTNIVSQLPPSSRQSNPGLQSQRGGYWRFGILLPVAAVALSLSGALGWAWLTDVPTSSARMAALPTPTLASIKAVGGASPFPAAVPPVHPTPTASHPMTPGVVYAQVSGTRGAGLHVRSGPGLRHFILTRLPEGSVVRLVYGQVQADGYTWWQVEMNDGYLGWCARAWLAPVW